MKGVLGNRGDRRDGNVNQVEKRRESWGKRARWKPGLTRNRHGRSRTRNKCHGKNNLECCGFESQRAKKEDALVCTWREKMDLLGVELNPIQQAFASGSASENHAGSEQPLEFWGLGGAASHSPSIATIPVTTQERKTISSHAVNQARSELKKHFRNWIHTRYHFPADRNCCPQPQSMCTSASKHSPRSPSPSVPG